MSTAKASQRDKKATETNGLDHLQWSTPPAEMTRSPTPSADSPVNSGDEGAATEHHVGGTDTATSSQLVQAATGKDGARPEPSSAGEPIIVIDALGLSPMPAAGSPFNLKGEADDCVVLMKNWRRQQCLISRRGCQNS